MIKQIKRFLLTALCLTQMITWTQAQHKPKDYLVPKVTINYPDHKVIAYTKPVSAVNMESDKKYFWASAGQINSTQGGFSGKLLNGGYQDFYLNKNLKENGLFVAGLKSGKWKSWNDTGILKDEYNWSSGLRNGRYTVYDSLGRLAESGKYRNDLLHGKQKIVTGDSVKVTFYKNGKVAVKKSIVPKFIRNIFSKKQ